MHPEWTQMWTVDLGSRVQTAGWGCACGVELSVPPTPFCCESNTARKMKSIFKKFWKDCSKWFVVNGQEIIRLTKRCGETLLRLKEINQRRISYMCLGLKKSCNLASMLQLQRALNNDMQPGDFIQNGGAPLARGWASSILCPSLTHQVSLRFHLVIWFLRYL